jgi:glucose-1-phosphate cytidylyltransferase
VKVAILAGGYGTRLGEETENRPKPMVEIGPMPILWHIMMLYWRYGFSDFVIALGYKGDFIKRWMVEYARQSGDLSVDTHSGRVEKHENLAHPAWNVDLVETGLKTQTAGRIRRLRPWVGDQTFMLTWGDGVSDIDLRALLDFHKSHKKLATMTIVRPPARFGHVEFEGNRVTAFTEKPQTAEGWINGAFFVLEPGVFDYIEGDRTHFEREPLENLTLDGQLMAYRHESFWQCMDTRRDKVLLERLWESGRAPWKTWES